MPKYLIIITAGIFVLIIGLGSLIVISNNSLQKTLLTAQQNNASSIESLKKDLSNYKQSLKNEQVDFTSTQPNTTNSGTQQLNEEQSWGKYTNLSYGFSISYPQGKPVIINDNDKKSSNSALLQLLEIMPKDESSFIIHLWTYNNSREGKSETQVFIDEYKENNFNQATKIINGNTVTIYSGEFPAESPGTGTYEEIGAFVTKGSYIYRLEILGGGKNINSEFISGILNSFKVK